LTTEDAGNNFSPSTGRIE